MKISIITTSFNAEKYIEETLESVLLQRGNFSLEYIVIDANSTDSTWEIIKKYKKLTDDGYFSGRNLNVEMKIFQEADDGMYSGISKGLQMATGDIVAYINADDFYLPNAFSCVDEVFTKNGKIKWLTGKRDTYNNKGCLVYVDLYLYQKDLIKKGLFGAILSHIQQESTFWRKELLNNFNYERFKTFKFAGDYFLWHEFAKNEDLYIINTLLSGFRQNENQKSSDMTKYNEEFFEIADVKKWDWKTIFKEIPNKRLKIKVLLFDGSTQKWVLGTRKINFLKKVLYVKFNERARQVKWTKKNYFKKVFYKLLKTFCSP